MRNVIIEGDCLLEMPFIPDKSIDMILADLPYGTTACKWDSVIPFELLWEQYERIIRPNGFIVLFGSQPFTTKLINSNIDNYSHQWIWDKKMSANPLLCKKMPLKNFEDIAVFCYNYNKYDFRRGYFEKVFKFIGETKSKIIKKTNQGLDHCFRIASIQFDIPTESNYDILIALYNINKMQDFIKYTELAKYKRIYNPQMTILSKERAIGGGKFNDDDFLGVKYVTNKKTTNKAYPTAIIKFSNRKRGLLHPTQKPVALMEYLIKTYTNEGDLVLDNTAGSGTTGVACINTNRDYILIEKDPKYFKLLENRINETYALDLL